MSATDSVPWRGVGRGTGLLARISGRGAFRWYLGAAFGLVYQVIEIGGLWSSHGGTGVKVLATAVLLALYGLYLVLPPIVWPESDRVRLFAVLAYWALTCVLFPLVSLTTVWVWTLIAAMVGFTWMRRSWAFAVVAALVAAQLVIGIATGFPDAIAIAPFITASVGVSTVAFARQIAQNQELRQAHAEIARLAVSEERARLARDLHDSLGHSLTVVAVKSELAGKLIDRDPKKAAAEIADIEKLARDGLGELRAAVAGYRDADIDNELVAAHSALVAAGIIEHLPHDGSTVDASLRALFGWVVREGVTNVIRHADARNCWIELSATRVSVRDDGRAAVDLAAAGSGLHGLRERAAAAGATLTAGPRPGGGFQLDVWR